MKKINKSIYVIIIALAILFINTACAYANTEIYESVENKEKIRNITRPKEVTSDMEKSSYWINKLGQKADKLILNSSQIEKNNKDIIEGADTGVYDFITITEKQTQAERKASVINAIQDDFDYMVRNYPQKDRKIYVDGELIDNLPYIENLKNAVLTTGFENNDEKVQLYAVGIKRTEVKMFPTKAIWGYDSPDDPDDESCNSTIEVNEPFVIRAKCTIGEDTFYWGLTRNCAGWINSKNVALFDSKEEWLDAWKVDINGKDFLVVTQDNIILEPSSYAPETSEVQLKIGTVLKLVPKNKIPKSVNQRATWDNYVVYLPTRDGTGKYVKSYALIAEHHKVSIGYMPLTQRNLLDIAFTCLGNRYGWGGMLGAMDCSAYAKAIYKCFGLDLPRNTTNQQNVPNRTVSLAEMTDEEKEEYIEKLPIGSMLFFPGHVMVYIGSENGKNYVISDTGTLSDSIGELDARSMYSVIINPLTVRRKNGNTWLTSITKALIFGNIPEGGQVDEEDIYVTTDEETQKGNITYSDGINDNMAKTSYWTDLLKEKNKELLNIDEIQKLNIQLNGKSRSDLNSKAVLVVTQDRIVLEPSISQAEVSEIELPMGTVLELVPEEKIPVNIGERGPWYNYVVYIPVTNENGEIENKYALIPEHYSVSVGYLTLTPENILEVAFSSLGDSYELMDNTTFISSVYNCFGLDLSFNSDINAKLRNKSIDVAEFTTDEKKEILNNIPVGSVLQVGSEYAIYLGAENNNYYMISSMDGEVNSIVLSRTTLEELTSIIDFTQNVEEGDIVNNDDGFDEIINESTTTDGSFPESSEKAVLTNPKTGDNIIEWITLMCVSFVGGVGAISKRVYEKIIKKPRIIC